MNSVNLIGRLTADPEVRYLESGKAIATFSIAITRTRDESDFFDVQAWEKTADVVSQYCKKGSQIGIEGRLRQERWQDRETQKPRSKVIVIANRIELLGSKDSAAGVPASGAAPRPTAFVSPTKYVDTDYDSIPF
jgi:single-strand DNA-binding protein